MHLLLSIGANSNEIEAAVRLLPGTQTLTHVVTLQEAQAYLQGAANPPFAVLVNGAAQAGWATACREVRAAFPQETTLIALVASVPERAAAYAQGADEVLLCPIEAAELAARLKHYCQFHQLLVERKELHQRALENERLATIGRLTASIVHSISNPMQAMRGALILAHEDSHSPRDVEEYVRLTQQELERISRLVTRMRQLYRPPTDEAVQVHLPDLLRDAFETAQEEAMRQKVRLRDELTLDVPAVRGIASQLQLAFVSIVLSLIDMVGEAGGGEIGVSAFGTKSKVRVEFLLPEGIATPAPEVTDCVPRFRYGLTPILDLIRANNGEVHFLNQGKQALWRIEF
ncbi:MAG: sensor histidine kinase [Chloroflexota bacterium]